MARRADPVEKNAFLAALALHGLIERGATGQGATGRGSGRPEMTVVVDTRVRDDHGAPVVDWGLPVDIPHEVLVDLFGQSDVAAVIVRNGAVLHAPGRMNLGRATRLANGAQRRVLRGLYPRCAIPDCPVRFDHCKIHHVDLVAARWPHRSRQPAACVLPAPRGHSPGGLDDRARCGPHPGGDTARRHRHVDRTAPPSGRVTAACGREGERAGGGGNASGAVAAALVSSRPDREAGPVRPVRQE